MSQGVTFVLSQVTNGMLQHHPAQAKKQSAHLPFDVLEKTFSFLDCQSLCRAFAVCHTWKDLTDTYRTALLVVDQLQVHKKTQDIYALLNVEMPDNLRFGGELMDAVYKESMKAALQAYTFFDALGHQRTHGQYVPCFNLIKLNGVDYRGLAEGSESERTAATHPQQLNGSEFFKMTPFAARTLAELVCKDERINALVVNSCVGPEYFMRHNLPLSHEALVALAQQKSFGDETALTLLQGLPAGRLELFVLSGGFGEKAMKEYIHEMPRLYDGVSQMDPKDTRVAGMNMPGDAQKADAFIDNCQAAETEYFAAKAMRARDSIVQRREQTQCSVM
ncbi:MAG: F-box protein [Chlamydiales bacterium]